MQTLALGAQGSPVGDLQQMLVEAGFAIAPDEAASNRFGATTDAAVRAYQAAHGLGADGIVGPKTLHAFEGVMAGGGGFTARGWHFDAHACPQQALRVVQFAISMIGIVEHPPHSNRGPEVDSFWRAPPTLSPGPPWCAAFVSTCYKRADGGSPFGFISSTFDLADWGTARGRLVAVGAPVVPGDIALILRDPVARHGHTTLVVGDLGDGILATVEGNAGDAVRGLVRPRNSFGAIVRPMP